MAWVSRISSERQRHVIVAIIMAVLFVGALGAGFWFTTQRDPKLATDRAGDFSLLSPHRWSVVPSNFEHGEGVRELSTWQEPTGFGGLGRRLNLFELHHDQPMSPLVAMSLMLGESRTNGPHAAVRSATMTGLLAEHVLLAADGRPQSQLLAVMTLDGLSHAVLVLERRGELRASDWRLMMEITASLSDARYAALPADPLRLNDVHIALPDVLTAVRRVVGPEAEAGLVDDQVLLIPRQETQFYVLEPRLVAQSEVELSPAVDLATDDEAEKPAAMAALLGRYIELEGELPAVEAVRGVMFGPRRVYVTALPDNGTGSRSALWAFEVKPDVAMVMQISASSGGAAAAETAARRLLAGLEPI